MSDDLTRLLQSTAVRPSAPADVTAIMRRARRRRGARRALLGGAGTLAVLAVLAVVPGGGLTMLADEPSPAPEEMPLPPVGTADPGVLADGTPVWVVNLGDTTSVVDARSPHVAWGLTKLVRWCPSSRGFDDVHGSQFDAAGRYLGGPSPTGLATYDHEVAGEAVRIGERRAPAERGEQGHPRTACEDEPGASSPVEHDLPRMPVTTDLLPPADRPRLVDGTLVIAADGATLCADGEDGGSSCPGGLPTAMDHEGYLDVAPGGAVVRSRMLVTVTATSDGPVVSEIVLVAASPELPADSDSSIPVDTALCEAAAVGRGPDAVVIAAFEGRGRYAVECWIDADIPKAPPGGRSFDRAVIGVTRDGEATLLRAGYRSEMQPPDGGTASGTAR